MYYLIDQKVEWKNLKLKSPEPSNVVSYFLFFIYANFFSCLEKDALSVIFKKNLEQGYSYFY